MATVPDRGDQLSSVRSGSVARSELLGRWDPRFVLGEHLRSETGSNWPILSLGSLATRIQYGSSALSGRDEAGTRILRMNNIRDDTWDLSDLKYVNLAAEELTKFELTVGDILVNRTNGSRELVGKSQVFTMDGSWVFASYLIRITVDTSKVLPGYVAAFLNSDRGRAQVTASSRQSLQTNVSATELRNLQLPLPPLSVQQSLIEALEIARSSRAELWVTAQRAIDSIGAFFDDFLNLGAGDDTPPKTFTIHREELVGKRVDAASHRPGSSVTQGLSTDSLASLVEVDPKVPPATSDMVPYVGLPQCSDTDVVSILHREWSQVRGRKSFNRGDLLVARIEPSVFNMKYPWARSDQVPIAEPVYTSTEFYVLRGSQDRLAFVLAALRSSFLQQQIRGRTTGSSGRRRLDKAVLSTLAVPRATETQATAIAQHTLNSLDTHESALAQARATWNEARLAFDAIVWGEHE